MVRTVLRASKLRPGATAADGDDPEPLNPQGDGVTVRVSPCMLLDGQMLFSVRRSNPF